MRENDSAEIFTFEDSARDVMTRDSPRTIVFFRGTKAAARMRAIDSNAAAMRKRRVPDLGNRARNAILFLALPRSCRSPLLLARVHRERI